MFPIAPTDIAVLGFAVLAIMYLVRTIPDTRSKLAAIVAIAALATLGLIKDYAVKRLKGTLDAQTAAAGLANGPNEPAASMVADTFEWVDLKFPEADWGGRDWTCSNGAVPVGMVNLPKGGGNVASCDAEKVGQVATCWLGGHSGYPFPDLCNQPAWCTYKDSRIGVATRPDGGAPPGKVYICARAVKQRK